VVCLRIHVFKYYIFQVGTEQTIDYIDYEISDDVIHHELYELYDVMLLLTIEIYVVKWVVMILRHELYNLRTILKNVIP